MESPVLQAQHLGWRAGFGVDINTHAQWQKEPVHHLIKKIFRQNNAAPNFISTPEADELKQQFSQPGGFKILAAADKKELFKASRDGIKNLNIAWIREMISTDCPLREKIALFWHGHFACRIINIIHDQQLLQIIRENALGNFGDLLFAVSKSPAMLQFLNNQQNRKQHPNENFAREVMELFTMGRGNYSEEDVKQGARAFTGWGFDLTGEFRFRPFFHDYGEKTFLGKTGNFDGDDILNMLLEHKATAYHVSEKLYKFLVNDTPDPGNVQSLADKFYAANYDIKTLLEAIFTADWFYDPKNIGACIKSPVELMVGMQRTLPATFANNNVLVLFQRVLGQVLFFPPNVAGWPGGKDWIDSSTLMLRLRLPQVIYDAADFNIQLKDMPDEMDDTMVDHGEQQMKSAMAMNNFVEKVMARKINADVQWDNYLKGFDGVEDQDLPEAVADALLVNVPHHVNTRELNNYSDTSSRGNYIKTLTINIMSTPEYQLC
jgi:uncharacterized protein (DUF1800 family)